MLAERRVACEDDDRRRSLRDTVACRVHGFGPDARPITLVVSNLSPHGLMAHVAPALACGDRLRLILPNAGVVPAEVRWIDAGRVGCRFDVPFLGAAYYELLAALLAG